LFGTVCGNGETTDGSSPPSCEIPAVITNMDGRGQGQAHEAAWDAHMTGTFDDTSAATYCRFSSDRDSFIPFACFVSLFPKVAYSAPFATGSLNRRDSWSQRI
jgi:hypothetical protein